MIVGAGFGGLNAARRLSKEGCKVTIIDRNPYTQFQPLLYQVATGGLNPGDVTFSLRSFAARHKHNMRYRRATVTGIDTENKEVVCDNGGPISYDYLILSQGVGANFFGIPGAEEHAKSIYTRSEALSVRDLIFSGLEKLAVARGDAGFSVVVVGGGATGVEMAGTLAEMQKIGLPQAFPEIRPAQVSVTLVEMAPHLLAPFDPSLREYTYRQLHERGVDVRLNTAISEVEETKVHYKDGTSQPADLVIWAAGIGGHEIVSEWGMPTGRGGRITVDENLLVTGHDDIFAIGDAAVIDDNALPQQAQPAIQMGQHAAQNILSLAKGQSLDPFRYVDKGTMATIGRNAAVVQLKQGPKFTGFPAWAMWVGLHLYFLLGGRNRIQAMVNLGTRYLMYGQNAAAIVGDIDTTPETEAIVPEANEQIEGTPPRPEAAKAKQH